MKRLVFTLIVLLVAGETCHAQWSMQLSGTKARLRGLSVVSSEVAWASGAQGTCLRTIDGGKHWVMRPVSNASSLDFRDVQAVSAETAFLLSIGPGEQSKIFKTTDGGATWRLSYLNRDPKGFLDAIAFWDANRGLAFGDPVDGRFVVLSIDDGGVSWKPTPESGMPLALANEGAFAASGTCLVVHRDGKAWFGTGGGKVARVFRTRDWGRSWTAHDTPVRAGNPSAGIFSLAFRDAEHGIAVGGDYKKPEQSGGSVATTSDGGETWTLASGEQPRGYRSCVAFVPGTTGRSLVVVGPTGTDQSEDGGESWRQLGTVSFDSVQFTGASKIGWAVGEDGRIARLGSE